MDYICLILCFISFLDTFSFGLIMPILTTHLLSLKGTHTIAGVLGSFHMLVQIFSTVISKECIDRYGRKITLIVSLIIGSAANILMGLTSSVFSIVLLRIVFYSLNHTQFLIKSIYNNSSKENQSIDSKLNIVSVIGFIVAPIIGGIIFEDKQGFYYLSLITGTLSLISSLLSRLLPNDPIEQNKKLKKTTLKEKITEVLNSYKELKKTDKKYKYIVIVKVLISTSFTAFFIKFSLLLKTQYQATNTQIGYTIAFQNLAIFLSTIAAPFLEKFLELKDADRFRFYLKAVSTTMFMVCFSPDYDIYLYFFVVFSLAKALIDGSWKEFEKNDGNLSHLFDKFSSLIGVLIPATLGYICDNFSYNGLRGYAVIPLVIACYIGSKYIYTSVEEKIVKDGEEKKIK